MQQKATCTSKEHLSDFTNKGESLSDFGLGALLNVLPDGQDWSQAGLFVPLSLIMTPLAITPNMGKQET